MPFPAPEIRGRVDSTGRARLYLALWEPRTLARDQGTPMQMLWLTQGQPERPSRRPGRWRTTPPKRTRAGPEHPRLGRGPGGALLGAWNTP